MGACQAQVGKIGQNAQPYPAAGNLFHVRGHGYGHGVDRVGAHGDAYVHNQMDDDQGASGRVGKPMNIDIFASAAQSQKYRVPAGGDNYNVLLVVKKNWKSGGVGTSISVEIELGGR